METVAKTVSIICFSTLFSSHLNTNIIHPRGESVTLSVFIHKVMREKASSHGYTTLGHIRTYQ